MDENVTIDKVASNATIKLSDLNLEQDVVKSVWIDMEGEGKRKGGKLNLGVLLADYGTPKINQDTFLALS